MEVGGSDRDQRHWLQNSLQAALILMLDLDSLSQRDLNLPTASQASLEAASLPPDYCLQWVEGCWVSSLLPFWEELTMEAHSPSAVRKGPGPAALASEVTPVSSLGLWSKGRKRGGGT